MSQHPSLRSSEKDKQQRTVLKRYERIKSLKEKEKWKDGDSVFGLPKVRVMRFKIKKEKAAAAEGTEAVAGAETAAAPAAPGKTAAAAPGKAAPAAKAPGAKDTAKTKEAEGKK